MKKPFAFTYLIICLLGISCWHNDHNISINYKNTDRYYSMDANFSRSRTRAVERYLDRKLGRESNMSFVGTDLDGTIALDDHTVFYVEKFPGKLKIKLDKRMNSGEAYRRIKSICENVKMVIMNNG
jgi:hypothetical protein